MARSWKDTWGVCWRRWWTTGKTLRFKD